MKCDTNHSAGLAFRSLHGCWFDGKLCKYLKRNNVSLVDFFIFYFCVVANAALVADQGS